MNKAESVVPPVYRFWIKIDGIKVMSRLPVTEEEAEEIRILGHTAEIGEDPIIH